MTEAVWFDDIKGSLAAKPLSRIEALAILDNAETLRSSGSGSNHVIERKPLDEKGAIGVAGINAEKLYDILGERGQALSGLEKKDVLSKGAMDPDETLPMDALELLKHAVGGRNAGFNGYMRAGASAPLYYTFNENMLEAIAHPNRSVSKSV